MAPYIGRFLKKIPPVLFPLPSTPPGVLHPNAARHFSSPRRQAFFTAAERRILHRERQRTSFPTSTRRPSAADFTLPTAGFRLANGKISPGSCRISLAAPAPISFWFVTSDSAATAAPPLATIIPPCRARIRAGYALETPPFCNLKS